MRKRCVLQKHAGKERDSPIQTVRNQAGALHHTHACCNNDNVDTAMLGYTYATGL